MKNTLKIVTALLLVLGLWSCENEDNFKILEPSTGSFRILTPTTNVGTLLKKESANNTAITLTWEKVDYGTPTAVTYTVQFAKEGTAFAAPIDISTAVTNNYTMTVGQLNARAAELLLDPDVEGAISVRIKSTVGTTGAQVRYSNPIILLVTPYSVGVAYAFEDWYMVGNATTSGWNNNSGNQPLYRTSVAGQYTFSGYFGVGEFKMIKNPGNWAPMIGRSGTGAIALRPTEADPDPANFAITTAGYYTFTMNTTSSILSFTLVPYAAGAGAPMFTRVGLIGSTRTGNDAGWNGDDTPLVKSTFDAHQWTLILPLKNGNGKFRSGNSWDAPNKNWGANTKFTGMGTQGGPDIPVEASKYKVYFNDLDGRYLMIPNQE